MIEYLQQTLYFFILFKFFNLFCQLDVFQSWLQYFLVNKFTVIIKLAVLVLISTKKNKSTSSVETELLCQTNNDTFCRYFGTLLISELYKPSMVITAIRWMTITN